MIISVQCWTRLQSLNVLNIDNNGNQASNSTGHHAQRINCSCNRVLQICCQYVSLLQSITLHSNIPHFGQHLIPTRSVSFRWLSHGEEVWPNYIGNSRPCIRKLSRQVNNIGSTLNRRWLLWTGSSNKCRVCCHTILDNAEDIPYHRVASHRICHTACSCHHI